MFELFRRLYQKFQFETRFVLVGIANTAVGYGTYALFIWMGMRLNLAYMLSTVIGVINSYILNKFFTFRSRRKSFWEVVRFVTVYAISFSIGYFFLPFMVHHLGINSYLAGICNIFVTTIISFFGHRFFSFRGVVTPSGK